MADSLKKQTITGAFWKLGERAGTQIMSFVVSILLARRLLPEDFAIIALVIVFMTICDKITISGFATALIQKKDADNLDFSTVFFFSIVVSLILYLVLFFSAPYIASFYSKFNYELLIWVIRIMGLRLMVIAVNSVQHAYVSRTMQFRRFFWSTSISTLIAGTLGVCMAYSGCGVWALVTQFLAGSILEASILWFTVRWRPNFTFSWHRLKSLFSYGWKLFVASLIKILYNDLRSLIIGKVYTPNDLAFYNRGQSFPQLADSNISGTIDAVLFPAISKKQNSKDEMLSMLRRAIRTSSFIIMPILATLAIVSASLIEILLTSIWLPSVIYMQILCFAYFFSPIELENLQAIKAIGRSDVVLKLEIIKKTVGLTILIISIPFGVNIIAVGMVISSLFSAIVNAIPNKKFLGYSIKMQFKDVMPQLFLSTLIFIIMTLFFPSHIFSKWTNLILQTSICAIFYLAAAKLLKLDSLQYIVKTVKSFRHEKKHA